MNTVKQCKRCVMDTTATSIFFDEKGICNYCKEFLSRQKKISNNFSQIKLEKLILNIKNDNKKNEYDCIIGLSGGIDSSYALYKSIQLGLKPLAVHMDNGWNSSLAQNNIANIVRELNIDLITYVVNWNEYRELMKSFFKANVIDIELLYDNAMLAVNYFTANQYNIKYIIAGSNQTTEGMEMPKNWNWFKYDKKNIKSINKNFQNIKIKSLPMISIYDYIYFSFFKGIKWVPILDYFEYNKIEAEILLKDKFKYIKYPYKHYESIFTRFYQAYILPTKFNIDKRKVHLSNLILTNQLKRNDALEKLKKPGYLSSEDFINDRDFFLKKMKWTKDGFDNYLKQREVDHDYYGSDLNKWKLIIKFRNLFKNDKK